VAFAGGLLLFKEAKGWKKLPAVLGILVGVLLAILGRRRSGCRIGGLLLARTGKIKSSLRRLHSFSSRSSRENQVGLAERLLMIRRGFHCAR
jgi:hypothetical protein